MTNKIVLPPLPEPYGRVTVHAVTGQHFFYRDPEPPYLDTAKECIVVYSSDSVHAHAADEVLRLREELERWKVRAENNERDENWHYIGQW